MLYRIVGSGYPKIYQNSILSAYLQKKTNFITPRWSNDFFTVSLFQEKWKNPFQNDVWPTGFSLYLIARSNRASVLKRSSVSLPVLYRTFSSSSRPRTLFSSLQQYMLRLSASKEYSFLKYFSFVARSFSS